MVFKKENITDLFNSILKYQSLKWLQKYDYNK